MHDPMKPTVIRGVLGWGNRKGGLEAYGPDGRWGGELRRRKTKWVRPDA